MEKMGKMGKTLWAILQEMKMIPRVAATMAPIAAIVFGATFALCDLNTPAIATFLLLPWAITHLGVTGSPAASFPHQWECVTNRSPRHGNKSNVCPTIVCLISVITFCLHGVAGVKFFPVSVVNAIFSQVCISILAVFPSYCTSHQVSKLVVFILSLCGFFGVLAPFLNGNCTVCSCAIRYFHK